MHQILLIYGVITTALCNCRRAGKDEELVAEHARGQCHWVINILDMRLLLASGIASDSAGQASEVDHGRVVVEHGYWDVARREVGDRQTPSELRIMVKARHGPVAVLCKHCMELGANVATSANNGHAEATRGAHRMRRVGARKGVRAAAR